MNTPNEIKLINPIDGSSITIKIAMLNGKRYAQLADIESRFRNTKKEANILFMLAQSDPETLKKNFETNPDIKPFKTIVDSIIAGNISMAEVIEIFEQGASEIVMSNYQRRIEIIKLMIDEKQLTTKLKELVDSQDFWEEQDVIYLKEIADSFRKLL